MLNITVWLVFGALTGWIGALADNRASIIPLVVLGAIGAFFGGLLTRYVMGSNSALNGSSLIGAIFGAIIITIIFQLVRGNKSDGHHLV